MKEKVGNLLRAIIHLALIMAFVWFLYILFCPICREPDGSLNTFLLAVLIGIPFGIRHMVIILPPESYGISGFFALCVLFVKRVAAVFAAVLG